MKGVLSYKNKNKLLIAVAVILLYLSYTLAIKETIAMYQTVNTMQEQILTASDAPAKLKMLEASLKEIEHSTGNTLNYTGSTVQQEVLDYISTYTQEHDIFLKEFPKTISSKQKDIKIETNVFTAEADFLSLVKLLYDMEKKHHGGKVSSVHFKSKQDYKTKAIALSSTIYLQYVRKEANEK